MKALITDVHLRSAVAGVRALGREGLQVLALAPSWSSAGLWSRYAARRAVAPDVESDSAAFAQELERLARSWGPCVVYPGREITIDAVLAASSNSSNIVLPYPPTEAWQALRDKTALPALAAAAGLRTPATLSVGTAPELARESLPVPSIIKAPRSTSLSEAAKRANSQRELEEVIRSLSQDKPFLVQEWSDGPLMALALVIDRDGNVAARFQQAAHRTWPAKAGPSSFAVSVAPDEQLVASTAGMLVEAGYWGMAQVQFIQSRNGVELIDVNPRFYGSLPLALACGVNLPAAWHAVASGAAPPPQKPYREGVSYRWLAADVLAALRGKPQHLLTRAPKPRIGAMWASDDMLAGAFLAAAAVGVPLRRRVLRRTD